jgi:tungstate transport system substrate-binding protein
MQRDIAAVITLAVVILATLGGYYIIRSHTSAGTRTLVVSTTTSLYDTGVLDTIEDAFEAENPIDLYFISVGTGLAITHAHRGDADMILVHAPFREFAFMEEGYGVNRKIVAYNFFSIVGPGDDPAGIRAETPTEALERLIERGRVGEAVWVSRGDDSGTHTKEIGLWAEVGFDASIVGEEDWYREAGAGMGKTLQIAEEYRAYTLTDMGTFLKYSKDDLVTLEVLVGAGEELINIYSAIAVDPEANPDANFEDAVTFTEYLTSSEGQAIFESFGVDAYGVSLFNPAVELLSTGSDPTTAAWVEAAGFFEGSECPLEYRRGETNLYRDDG